jgi:hypothetical protein
MNAKFMTPRLKAVDAGGAGDDRVRPPALFRRRRQPVGVVLELERIDGAQVPVELAPGAGVGEDLDVLLRRDPPMPPALGADVQRLLELLPQIDVPAAVALLPRVGRDLQPFALRRPWLAFLLKPCHHGHR